MGETGVGAVEAEAAVHTDTVVMRSIHMVHMVLMVHMVHVVHVALIEEMMTEIIVTMIGGVGGLEAEVLHVEEDEAEALVEEGIRVQSGKAVLREGLRLSNGIGKENRQKLLIRMIIATVTMVTTTMTLNKMINSIIIHSIRRRTSSSSSSMEDTTIDPIGTVWFVPVPIFYQYDSLGHWNKKSFCNFCFTKAAHLENIAYSPFSTVQVEYRFTVL